MKGFHNSFLAGSFQSVAVSVAVSVADGGDVADHSWVGIGQSHGASVVGKAERPECPEQDCSFSASELPVAEFSAGGHYGAESGQSSLHEVCDAAVDINDASLLTALLAAAAAAAAAAALSRDGYCASEIPLELEHAVAGPADVDWTGFAAAQQLKVENCIELQFASVQGLQSCY